MPVRPSTVPASFTHMSACQKIGFRCDKPLTLLRTRQRFIGSAYRSSSPRRRGEKIEELGVFKRPPLLDPVRRSAEERESLRCKPAQLSSESIVSPFPICPNLCGGTFQNSVLVKKQ